jgi:hypothetical protein
MANAYDILQKAVHCILESGTWPIIRIFRPLAGIVNHHGESGSILAQPPEIILVFFYRLKNE